MLSGTCRRALDFARRAAEARRRRRLHHAVDLDEGPAMAVVRMLRRLNHIQHRREADLAAFHDRAPLIAGLGLEYRLQPLLQRGPLRAIVLARKLLALQPGQPQEFGVKLALDRTDRDVLAVAGLVDVVIVRAGVEDVFAAVVVPHTRAAQ